jgi:hypothetical protein
MFRLDRVSGADGDAQLGQLSAVSTRNVGLQPLRADDAVGLHHRAAARIGDQLDDLIGRTVEGVEDRLASVDDLALTCERGGDLDATLGDGGRMVAQMLGSKTAPPPRIAILLASKCAMGRSSITKLRSLGIRALSRASYSSPWAARASSANSSAAPERAKRATGREASDRTRSGRSLRLAAGA